jgi:hypothetical protein
MLTIKALRLMNTEHFTAFQASPLFFFISNEMPYAEFSNFLKIFNHAHAVLSSITLIQMLQSVARKAVTSKAVPNLGVYHLLAVIDSTCYAGFRFEAVITPAPRARLLISHECAAKAAIHSAGSD